MSNSKIKKWIFIISIIAGIVLFFALRCSIAKQDSYSRDSLYISIKQNQTHELVKLFFVDNEAYAFLPSYTDLSKSQLLFGDDVFVSLADRMYKRKISLADISGYEFTDVQILDKQTKENVDVFRLKILKSDNIPAVFLSTQSGNLDYILEEKGNGENTQITIVNSDGNLAFNRECVLCGRGNSTWEKSDKKPFGLKLKDEISLLGMTPGRKWCLLANSLDNTYMGNMLAFDMANACMDTYNPSGRFIDLYINNEYYGNYVLTEDLEISKTRVDIPKLSDENQKVNPGLDMSSVDIIKTEEKGDAVLPNNPEDITGGYFIEQDFRTPKKKAVSYFRTEDNLIYNIKEPKYASIEEVDYISSLVQEMDDVIQNIDNPTFKNRKKAIDYIDVDSWVNWYMVAEITHDTDKAFTNIYLIKYPDSVSKKIYMGPSWDFDNRWGANGKSAFILTKLDIADDGCNWISKLYNEDLFFSTICEKWNSSYKDYLKNVAPEKIDFWESQIQRSVDMDVIRWGGESSRKNPLDYSLQFNCEKMKGWIEAREQFLSGQWDNGL